LFLYSEPRDSCIECSGICPQGVRDCRVQVEVTFVLSSQECRVGTKTVQGVHRLEEVSVVNLRKELRTAAAGSAQSLKDSTLESC
jgi:hypothetical protein